jgi:hypothetical protein
MAIDLTLLLTTSRSPRGGQLSSAICSAWAQDLALPTAGPGLLGNRWESTPPLRVLRRSQ